MLVYFVRMADQGAQLTEGFALQPFVEKASKLSGDALAQVVSEALAHPLVYVFQELLDLPNVQNEVLQRIGFCASESSHRPVAVQDSHPIVQPAELICLRQLL